MSWAVMLGGTYQPYEQSISDTIENAFQHGNSEVLIQLRGTRYLIALKPANGFKQKLESDLIVIRRSGRGGDALVVGLEDLSRERHESVPGRRQGESPREQGWRVRQAGQQPAKFVHDPK